MIGIMRPLRLPYKLVLVHVLRVYYTVYVQYSAENMLSGICAVAAGARLVA